MLDWKLELSHLKSRHIFIYIMNFDTLASQLQTNNLLISKYTFLSIIL
jgi:hypothetical protein